MELEQLKLRVGNTIDQLDDRLWDLACRIHARPELGFQEQQAAAWLTEELEQLGFEVERGIANLPTAFKAWADGQPDGPTVAIQAEYDALPDIGHACGHNLIAGAAVGAAAAVKSVLPDLAGRIMVIGTPAEEGGGGKIIMLERGAYDGVDVALYVHAHTHNGAMGTNMAHASLTAQFRGVPASAGGGKAPEGEEHLGASALAGLITMFNNINAIRQHIQRDVVIRGVITRGGSRRETVPLLCEGWFSARGPDHRYLKEVLGKFENCARAAALATGTEVELTPGPLYAERLPNAPLSQDLRENMVRAGLDNVRSGAPAASSTDSGNVSQVVPLGAARVAIADPSVSGHSPGFAEAARTERAHAAMLAGAKSLAWTAVDLMARQDLFNAVREDFSTRTGHTLIGDAQALTLTR